uniref:Gag-pol polyprotein n=1 Tax=Solanum tuberosum TaxID=4113 RepID=M1D894_SOLTU
MPPRKAVRGRPTRHNVEEKELPNAPEVQLQGEVTNAEFREAIRMLSQVFTQLSRYAPKMVADMKSRISLFVAGLSRLSSKEGRVEMLIGDMDISRLMVYVQKVEEEKLRDMEEFKNKRAKTGNESGQQKSNANRSSFQQKQKGPAPSSASASAPNNKRVAPRGATSGTGGGTNHLYAINSGQEHEDSPDVVTVLEWKNSSAMPKGRLISYLKEMKLVSKGCVYHLV